MEDEPRVPDNLTTVSLDEAWEIDYWAKALGATEQDLRDAVQCVGRNAEEVRRFLRRKDPTPLIE